MNGGCRRPRPPFHAQALRDVYRRTNVRILERLDANNGRAADKQQRLPVRSYAEQLAVVGGEASGSRYAFELAGNRGTDREDPQARDLHDELWRAGPGDDGRIDDDAAPLFAEQERVEHLDEALALQSRQRRDEARSRVPPVAVGTRISATRNLPCFSANSSVVVTSTCEKFARSASSAASA